MRKLFILLGLLLCFSPAAPSQGKASIRKAAGGDIACSGVGAPDAACIGAGARVVRWEIFSASSPSTVMQSGFELFQVGSGGVVSHRTVREILQWRLDTYLDTQGEVEPQSSTNYTTPFTGAPFPPGGIILIVSGLCPAGFAEETTLSGKFLLGTLAANTDIGDTGGANSVTPTTASISLTAAAQTVNSLTAAAQTFTGSPFSSVINHTHPVTDPGHTHPSIQVQGGTTASTSGTHIMTSTATGGSSRAAITPEKANSGTTGVTTTNPAGGVASITPAGSNAASAVTGTMNSSAVAGSVTLNSQENRPAFMKVIFCKKQ